MVKMKTLVILLLAYSVAGIAANDGFEDRKKRTLERVDHHITTWQTFKSCVESATAKESLKACRKAKRDAMKKFRDEHKKKK